MSWRRWNRVVHRDLGYLCVGLTLAYGISGLAVNHIDAWNPSYRLESYTGNVGSLEGVPLERVGQEVLDRLGDEGVIRATFRPAPDAMQILLEERSLTVNLADGNVEGMVARPRAVLHPLNKLHLNHLKGAWTWVADLFAAALVVLAVTGAVLIPGRRGLRGRGGVLVALGVLLPALFLLVG